VDKLANEQKHRTTSQYVPDEYDDEDIRVTEEPRQLAPLLVYVLLDKSGSMRGEGVVSIRSALQTLLTALREIDGLDRNVLVSVSAFDRTLAILFALSNIADVITPVISVERSNPSMLGTAVVELASVARKEVSQRSEKKLNSGPVILLVMTDGVYSDPNEIKHAFNSQTLDCFDKVIIGNVSNGIMDSYLCRAECEIVSLATLTMNDFLEWLDTESGPRRDPADALNPSANSPTIGGE